MVMLNIYFQIISGFIYQALTRLNENLVARFVTVFRFCHPMFSEGI